MIIYEKSWRNKTPIEHDIRSAVTSAVTPDPYSYETQGERVREQVDKLTEMFARLLERLHTDGALHSADVVKIIGHGFHETKAQAE